MEKQKQYFIPDIETGIPYQVTKEIYEQYIKSWEYFRVKINNTPLIGKVMVFGIGGDLNGNDNLEELFYKPDNYNIERPNYFIPKEHD